MKRIALVLFVLMPLFSFAQTSELSKILSLLKDLEKRIAAIEGELSSLKKTAPASITAVPVASNLASVTFKLAADNPIAGAQIIKGSTDVLLASFEINNADTTTDVYIDNITFVCHGCSDQDVAAIHLASGNGRVKQSLKNSLGQLLTAQFPAGEFLIAKNSKVTLTFKVDTSSIGDASPRGLYLEIKSARVLTPVGKEVVINLPIVSPALALIPPGFSLASATGATVAGAGLGYCVVKNDATSVYPDSDPASGFVKELIARNVKTVDELKQRCAYAYENVTNSYCARTPLVPYRRGVLLVNNSGSFYDCGVFGCQAQSCPTTATAATPAVSTVTVAPTTAAPTNISPTLTATYSPAASPTTTFAPSSASPADPIYTTTTPIPAGGVGLPANSFACRIAGYTNAYRSYFAEKPGITNLADLKAACGSTDFKSLLQRACNDNPNFHGWEDVVNITSTSIISSCGQFGCGTRNCFQLATYDNVVSAGACFLGTTGFSPSEVAYQSPDSGAGYAKKNMAGTNDEDINSQCTDGVYSELLSFNCANRSVSGSIFKAIARFDSKGSLISYGCKHLPGSSSCVANVFITCPIASGGHGFFKYLANIFRFYSPTFK